METARLLAQEGLAIIKYNRGVHISYCCRLGWKRVRKHQQTRKDGQPYAVVEPWWEERKECERIVYMHEIRGMSFGEIAVFCNKNGEVSVQGMAKGKRKGEEKWTYMMVRKRYLAAKAMYPRRSYDDETGQNSEVLMVPTAVP